MAERKGQDSTDSTAGATESNASDRAAKKAHDVIDRAADAAAGAEQRLRAKAEEARDRALAAGGQARANSDEWVNEARLYIHERPIAAVGVAFVAGYIMAALFRR